MMKIVLKITVPLILLVFLAAWFFRGYSPAVDAQMAKGLGMIFDENPSLLSDVIHKKNKPKVIPPDKPLASFFNPNAVSIAVMAALTVNSGNSKPFPSQYPQFLEDPHLTIRTIGDAYLKMPAYHHQTDRTVMLDMISQTAEMDERSRDASRDQAKEFFLQVIETKTDPIDNHDPLASPSFNALRHFLTLEKDEAERKRVANMLLDQNRTPAVKIEIQRLLETYPGKH